MRHQIYTVEVKRLKLHDFGPVRMVVGCNERALSSALLGHRPGPVLDHASDGLPVVFCRQSQLYLIYKHWVVYFFAVSSLELIPGLRDSLAVVFIILVQEL